VTCSADFAKNCAILVGSSFNGLAAGGLREKVANFVIGALCTPDSRQSALPLETDGGRPAKTKIFGQHDEATLKQMVSAGDWPRLRTISLAPILAAAILSRSRRWGRSPNISARRPRREVAIQLNEYCR
jgi:hypothetical protein